MEKYSKYIKNTIEDFNTFVNYLETENPILTKTGMKLSKKDAYNLNSKLNFKKDVEEPKYNQDQYCYIDLMFSLVIDSDMYYIVQMKNNKFMIKKSSKVDMFLQLNEFEKYVFLFQCYLEKYDFMDRINGGYGFKIRLYDMINSITGFIKDVEENENYVKIDREGENSFFLKNYGIIIYHFSFFGLCIFEPKLEKKYYKYELENVSINKFGVHVFDLLSNTGESIFIPFGEGSLEIIDLLEYKKNKKKPKKEKVFEILKNIFPKNLVNKTIKSEEIMDINKKGVYVFKVSLTNKIWRKIEISHKHTFTDFHDTIQEAYDFDDDHMYEFFIGGNERKHKMSLVGTPFDGIENDITIEEANLYKGQKSKYLFDYGDNWLFDILLLEIKDKKVHPKNPEVVESKGESPEQYENGDDYF